MPQLGETVTEGTIVRWLKQVGDAVAVDDVLFEVSTDKVDTEVPSAYAGFLRRHLVAEGETVPIGTPLAVLTDTADEPFDDAPARAESPRSCARRRRPPVTPARRPAVPATRAGASGIGSHQRLPVPGRAGSCWPSTDWRPRTSVGRAATARSPAPTCWPPPPTARAVRADRRGPGRARARRPELAGPAPVRTTRSSSSPGAPETAAEHDARRWRTSAHTLVVTEVDYHGVDAGAPVAPAAVVPAVRGPGRHRCHRRVPARERLGRRRRS